MATRLHADGRRARNSADALLDAAGALIRERDSVNITFSDITRKSGLNSALIHYRFGGKAGLLLALLERDVGDIFSDLDRLVAADLGAVEKLRRHIHATIRFYFRHPYANRLAAALAAETGSAVAQHVTERFTRPLANAQAAILSLGVAEGVFRPIDPMFFYFSLVGMCDHLFSARHALKWAFGINDIDDSLRRRYADHVVALLMESVLTEPRLPDTGAQGN